MNDPSPEDPFAPKYQIRFDETAIRPMVLTDAQGRFGWKVPPGEMMDLVIKRGGYYPRKLRVASSERWKVADEFYDHARPVLLSPVEAQLRELVEISVTVMDPETNPVDDAYDLWFRTSNGRSGRVKLRKDVTWKTTAQSLRDSAGKDGQLKLRVTFPSESGLLDIEQLVSAEKLIANRSLRFEAIRGAHVSGRVVSSADRSGIRGVEVCWHSDSSRIPHTLYVGWTNEEGRWEAVVPQESGFLSVFGEATGYDLATIERFNRNSELQQRFTRVFQYDGRDRVVMNDFIIDPISKQLVRVVDSNGVAVAKVEVSADRVETVEQDGRVYRFSQWLAETVVTDERGECELTLARSHWEDGKVKASLHEFDDFGNVTVRRYGHRTIEPNSASPLVIILKDPWRVTGRVIVDGRPASGFGVAVTLRFYDSKWFGQIGASATVSEDGTFEIIAPADYAYSVAVYPRTLETPGRYYYLQKPVTKVGLNQFRAEDININSNQLKTTQEFFEDLKKE